MVNPAPVGRFYGLLGEKLDHSISPQIHSFLFQCLGAEAGYYLFPVRPDELSAALSGLKVLGASGVNVTIPHKVAVMDLLDELSPEATAIGAVNTIIFNGRRTKGYNTDYEGFGLMLAANGISVRGKRALVLGTGGAAKTVACYLKDHGIRDLWLVTRSPSAVRSEWPLLSYRELSDFGRADLLVNCTPVGMYPHTDRSPVGSEILNKIGVVADLIYNPAETRLMREARRRGLKTCNGLTMLVGQAVAAEELWQNCRIDRQMIDEVQRVVGGLVAG